MCMAQFTLLNRFEKVNGHLAQVEKEKVVGFMCHRTTQVPLHNAVPDGVGLLTNSLPM